MVTLAGFEADDKKFTGDRTDASDCIFTMTHQKYKRFLDLINILIGYSHDPYKIMNIGNMLRVEL